MFSELEGVTDVGDMWDPRENLGCPGLIEAFLNSPIAGKEKDGTKRKHLSAGSRCLGARSWEREQWE